mmetsp:Transcript_5384/g.19432  ORF Transcript_5384/g.19432 Transcript_5384/m.19432 type:complete len:248 (-) Transcript_5384:17-760(-)
MSSFSRIAFSAPILDSNSIACSSAVFAPACASLTPPPGDFERIILADPVRPRGTAPSFLSLGFAGARGRFAGGVTLWILFLSYRISPGSFTKFTGLRFCNPRRRMRSSYARAALSAVSKFPGALCATPSWLTCARHGLAAFDRGSPGARLVIPMKPCESMYLLFFFPLPSAPSASCACACACSLPGSEGSSRGTSAEGLSAIALRSAGRACLGECARKRATSVRFFFCTGDLLLFVRGLLLNSVFTT